MKKTFKKWLLPWHYLFSAGLHILQARKINNCQEVMQIVTPIVKVVQSIIVCKRIQMDPRLCV